MRQLTILVCGLMLIFCWATLIRTMRDRSNAPESARSVTAQPAREPQRLANLPTRNLKDAPSKFTSAELAFQYLDNGQSNQVVAASAADLSAIREIIDTPGGSMQDWIWKDRVWVNGVWLRSNKLKLRMKDSSLAGIQVRVVYPAPSTTNTTISAELEVAIDDLPAGEIFLKPEILNTANPTITITTKKPDTSDYFRLFVPDPNNFPNKPQWSQLRLGLPYPWESFSGGNKKLFQDVTTTIGLEAISGNVDQVRALIVGTFNGNREVISCDVPPLTTNSLGANRVVQQFQLPLNEGMLVGQKATDVEVALVLSKSLSPEIFNHTVSDSAKFAFTNQPAANPTISVSQVYGTASTAAPLKKSLRSDNKNLEISHTPNNQADPPYAINVFSNGNRLAILEALGTSPTTSSKLELSEGHNRLTAQLFAGDQSIVTSPPVDVDVRTDGFEVINVEPLDFGLRLGADKVLVTFSRSLDSNTQSKIADWKTASGASSPFKFQHSTDGRFDGLVTQHTASEYALEDNNKSIRLTLTPNAGAYQLRIAGDLLTDVYGNKLTGSDGTYGGTFVQELGGSAGPQKFDFTVAPGVNRSSAPFVQYPEFVEPRKNSKGFNPSDKVETRVARLYFYRDAHRVAQILNRRVQSYNRNEVSVRHQQAQKARQEAESLTTNRQIAERDAVRAAQQTRELENQLSDVQRSLDSTLQQVQIAASQQFDPGTTGAQNRTDTLNKLQSAAKSFDDQARNIESQIRSAREKEIATNELWQVAQRKEELARTDQFRLETAAAHADPDTYAAGDPLSVDPVAQVSISVIGEGLIHLRGPLKGVNQLRLMVDQIDSPQGQVRVNVHSTQINGDEADKLEVVANRIQTYIDQGRFMTVQSGEYLRKAVAHVASARADEARGMYPGASQAERDQLYLHAFFGRDFIAELHTLDSEFLHTGNKLLSLHSMDVTSLSSALTMMALANNGTRLAILQEFQRLLQSDLTVAEQEYLRNGIGCCTGGCKLGCKHSHHAPPICSLAPNATFTSLRGFFDAQIQHDDTMTPLQREMIRLAQILKARLVTEMEYKQRVMERAVIEERTGQHDSNELQLQREFNAQRELESASEKLVQSRAAVVQNVAKSMAIVDRSKDVLQHANEAVTQIAWLTGRIVGGSAEQGSPVAQINPASQLQSILNRFEVKEDARTMAFSSLRFPDDQPLKLEGDLGSTSPLWATKPPDSQPVNPDEYIWITAPASALASLDKNLQSIGSSLQQASIALEPFINEKNTSYMDLKILQEGINSLSAKRSGVVLSTDNKDRTLTPVVSVASLKSAIERVIRLIEERDRFMSDSDRLALARDQLINLLTNFAPNLNAGRSVLQNSFAIQTAWERYASAARAIYDLDAKTPEKSNTDAWLKQSQTVLEEWFSTVARLDVAFTIAKDARRPLDHKKFLDMLIDDLEEKYIELLEGTRAHTANIDNYLKRLTTSLDDDFNTQFYFPVFRLVREASQFKRVEFGQTETTNVLANNRQFAKVSPSATMEFDLPKRDILIEEGLDAALAIYNDVGALVNDPNLMALAKLKSGGSVASPPAGSLGGFGSVRNVLPSLNGSSPEQLLARTAGSGPEFESNVEKLIPAPAIYKFETGTGYEIRPVIAPDGQAVVFDFHYLYTTQVREPVRSDEKHLGRVKQHFIDTDVQLSNFELREVSRYVVALKAERTAKGVPLLEDIPLVGALWRPLPSDEKSLQQNIIMAQATIFPTLFDLMGLRWAPAVSDLDPLRLINRDFLVRERHRYLQNRIYDVSTASVDEFLRIPEDARRPDLYRSQETIPSVHPNGYRGPGLDLQNSQMREGYDPESLYVPPAYIPGQSAEGAIYLPNRQGSYYDQLPPGATVTQDKESLQLSPLGQGTGRPAQIPASPQANPSAGQVNDGWQYSK